MPITILLFFVGILSSLLFKQIPSIFIPVIIILSCIFIILLRIKKIKFLIPIGFGCAWALLRAYFITVSALPATFENHPVLLKGFIASIPVQQINTTSFIFHAIQIDEQSCDRKFQLTYPQGSGEFHVGEYWHFVTRLKKPHSLMNPGCFDLEEQYFKNQLQAHGTILKDKRNHNFPSPKKNYPVQKLRENIQNKILNLFQQNIFCGILLALSVGITNYITPAQWETLRATGTNHLVAISGLHIGLISWLFSRIIAKIWGFIPNGLLRVPVVYIESIAGVIAACIYSVIAGLSASTERSMIMIFFFTLANLSRRKITTFRSLLFSLGMIMVVDPFAVLSIGFWLSYIAVGLLIYGLNGRTNQTSVWWKWGKPQWVVSIGMLPSVIYFFQQTSLLSIPANIVAIPWISFLVVPGCLLGMILLMFSSKLGGVILKLSLYLLKLIWSFLDSLTHLSSLIWHYAFNNTAAIYFSHLAAYLSLFPEGLVYRFIPLLWWLPIFNAPPSLPPHSFQLVIFDVGQGLATLVRTKNHVLIFDTGVKINEDYDMGKAVILPYLLQQGINNIDILTISHGDNDHIGGADSILHSLPVTKIITSVPKRFNHANVSYCYENMTWQWDGINFKFLSPPKGTDLMGNDTSCVLKITKGKQGILLTGDIEKPAEEIILQRHLRELRATILVAPHHGSKTSSSERFIKAIAPAYVIFSSGYLNSYRHPHREVIDRYIKLKSQLLNTVTSGAITMTLHPDARVVVVEEYRKKHQKIWHHH